jgi:hypothetical protein
MIDNLCARPMQKLNELLMFLQGNLQIWPTSVVPPCRVAYGKCGIRALDKNPPQIASHVLASVGLIYSSSLGAECLRIDERPVNLHTRSHHQRKSLR